MYPSISTPDSDPPFGKSWIHPYSEISQYMQQPVAEEAVKKWECYVNFQDTFAWRNLQSPMQG